MSYSLLDKYEMALRQGKVDISQGSGNALKCAIDFVKAFGFEDREHPITIEEAALEVERWQKVFLAQTNGLIEDVYASWLKANDPKLKEQFNIKEIEEAKAETKTISVDEEPKNPFWEAVKAEAMKHNKPEIYKLAEENTKPIKNDEL